MLETRRRTVRLKAEDDNVIADQNVSMTLRTTLSSSCSGPSGLLFCSMRSIFGSPERDWWATTSSFTIKSALNLHPVVLVFRVKPNPCSSVPGGTGHRPVLGSPMHRRACWRGSVPGGTGHRPVLSGDSPDSRAPDARTEWWTTVVRPTRRQVAAENGQVGRSTRTNCIVPVQSAGRPERVCG